MHLGKVVTSASLSASISVLNHIEAIMDSPVVSRPKSHENDSDKPLPLDLSHHYSETTKQRFVNKMKEFYKFMQIPGIANLAGGTYPLIFIFVLHASLSLAHYRINLRGAHLPWLAMISYACITSSSQDRH